MLAKHRRHLTRPRHQQQFQWLQRLPFSLYDSAKWMRTRTAAEFAFRALHLIDGVGWRKANMNLAGLGVARTWICTHYQLISIFIFPTHYIRVNSSDSLLSERSFTYLFASHLNESTKSRREHTQPRRVNVRKKRYMHEKLKSSERIAARKI